MIHLCVMVYWTKDWIEHAWEMCEQCTANEFKYVRDWRSTK